MSRKLFFASVIAVTLALAARTYLFSEPISQPDPQTMIETLTRTVQELQEQINDLRRSIKKSARPYDSGPSVRYVVNRGSGELGPAEDLSVAANLEKAQHTYQEARRAEDFGSYDDAIAGYTQAVELDPENDSAFLHRAYCYYAKSEYNSAIEDITRSLAIQPDSARAYAKRAQTLAAMGREDTGLFDLEQAIRHDPRNPDYHLARGQFYEWLGRSDDALADYNKAIFLEPMLVKAYLARATIFRREGKLKESMEDCYKIVEINPSEPSGFICRAEFYLETENPRAALDEISRALLNGAEQASIAPTLTSVQRALEVQRSPADARKENVIAPAPMLPSPVQAQQQGPKCTGESAIDARAENAYRSGRTLSAQQHFRAAIPLLDDAIRIDPCYSLALNSRGYVHLRLREYQAAIADFTAAIQSKADYANALVNRSAAKKASGDKIGAQEDLRRALELTSSAALAKRTD